MITYLPPFANLVADLSNPQIKVRRAAVKQLYWYGALAFPVLLRALQDRRTQVRYAAVQVLHKLGDPKATPALIEHLTDRSPRVQEAVLRALVHLQDAHLSVRLTTGPFLFRL